MTAEPITARRGYIRWLICALLFAIVALNYIDRQVLSVLKPDLQKMYGWSESGYADVAFASKDIAISEIMDERFKELCFEGFRFWDLRRWKLNLTEAAKGVSISSSNVYTISTIENRQYTDNMYYGPLPYNDVLKENLVQNTGW